METYLGPEHREHLKMETNGGQRGQTDSLTEGYKILPVPRRLVGETHIPPNLLAGEQGEVGNGSKTSFQLCRLPV